MRSPYFILSFLVVLSSVTCFVRQWRHPIPRVCNLIRLRAETGGRGAMTGTGADITEETAPLETEASEASPEAEEEVTNLIRMIVKSVDEGKQDELREKGLKVTQRSAREALDDKINDAELQSRLLAPSDADEAEMMKQVSAAIADASLQPVTFDSDRTVFVDAELMDGLRKEVANTVHNIRQEGSISAALFDENNDFQDIYNLFGKKEEDESADGSGMDAADEEASTKPEIDELCILQDRNMQMGAVAFCPTPKADDSTELGAESTYLSASDKAVSAAVSGPSTHSGEEVNTITVVGHKDSVLNVAAVSVGSGSKSSQRTTSAPKSSILAKAEERSMATGTQIPTSPQITMPSSATSTFEEVDQVLNMMEEVPLPRSRARRGRFEVEEHEDPCKIGMDPAAGHTGDAQELPITQPNYEFASMKSANKNKQKPEINTDVIESSEESFSEDRTHFVGSNTHPEEIVENDLKSINEASKNSLMSIEEIIRNPVHPVSEAEVNRAKGNLESTFQNLLKVAIENAEEQVEQQKAEEAALAAASADDDAERARMAIDALTAGETSTALPLLDIQSVLGDSLMTLTHQLGIDMNEELKKNESVAQMKGIIAGGMTELMKELNEIDAHSALMYAKLEALGEDIKRETEEYDKKKSAELEDLLVQQGNLNAELQENKKRLTASQEQLTSVMTSMEENADPITAVAMFPLKTVDKQVAFIVGLALALKVPFDSLKLLQVLSFDLSDWFGVFVQTGVVLACANHYGLLRAIFMKEKNTQGLPPPPEGY